MAFGSLMEQSIRIAVRRVKGAHCITLNLTEKINNHDA